MIDFQKRLKSLKDRRQGSRERAIFDSAVDQFTANRQINEGIDLRKKESFELLNETAGIKYAIGAMAEVNPESTRISISEGERVSSNLIKQLENRGINTQSRIQGSVPLNIHIKGHSDVDMLILLKSPLIVEQPKVNPDRYSPSSDTRSMTDIIRELRLESETILQSSYPKVEVDISNNKSIALKGGSLRRDVDIVPAHWYDTIDYQRSGDEKDRGVNIYHKSDHSTLSNYPFVHIYKVNMKDETYSGNLKSVTRLMKNMVADMPDYKKRVAKKLSSYDLAGIAYHMNEQLRVPSYMKLGLVEKLRLHLALLKAAESYRNSLDVPDGTRKIFDNNDKVDALDILAKETEDLAIAIFKELALQG